MQARNLADCPQRILHKAIVNRRRDSCIPAADQGEHSSGILSRLCLGKRRIPSLKILRVEARAWNGRVNRDQVKIAWKLDRKTARRKFGYNRKSFKRERTFCPLRATPDNTVRRRLLFPLLNTAKKFDRVPE